MAPQELIMVITVLQLKALSMAETGEPSYVVTFSNCLHISTIDKYTF